MPPLAMHVEIGPAFAKEHIDDGRESRSNSDGPDLSQQKVCRQHPRPTKKPHERTRRAQQLSRPTRPDVLAQRLRDRVDRQTATIHKLPTPQLPTPEIFSNHRETLFRLHDAG